MFRRSTNSEQRAVIRSSRDRLFVGLILLAGLTGGSVRTVYGEGAVKIAPEFVLRSLEGQNLRLSELRGEVVMVNFWASWCGACRSAMPSLNELDEKYRRAGLKVLSVNVDDEQQRAAHMSQSLKIRFPVLRDEQKTVARLYKADTLPLTVLIDREGNIRYSHTGYNIGDEQKYVAELRTLLNE